MNAFILPSIGEGIDTVSVSELSIKEKQQINKDDIIMLVETDKASMEIPADFSGTIKKIHIKVGDLISPGQKILDYNSKTNSKKKSELITENDEVEIIESEEEAKDSKIIPTSYSDIKTEPSSSKHASPSIRKLSRDLGCDISKIEGTGNNQRITKEDVYNYVNQNLVSTQIKENPDSNNTDYINNFSQYGKLNYLI